MTPRAPSDPARLAAQLGAATFGGPRWWTLAECAAYHGYALNHVKHWPRRGWAADLPQRRANRRGIHGGRREIWCQSPPPPPPDTRAGRRYDDLRPRVVAAVLAAGGPPGRGNHGGGSFWARIGEVVGLSAAQAYHRWRNAVALGEIPVSNTKDLSHRNG